MQPTTRKHDVVDGFAMADPITAPRTSVSGFLLDALRRRRSGRALLSSLTTLLFIAGAGMFTYPFFTDVYTEQLVQRQLEDQFVRIEVDTFDEWEATIEGETGAPVTKIVIPKLGVETLVVEGTSPAALRAGAGHYPNTPLPGQVGNVAIAGHRTTYGRPFNRLDELSPGDEIWLVTPVGDYLYTLPSGSTLGWSSNPYVTHPKDWSVIAPTPAVASVTLTTCHPKGSARERLIVRATLAESHAAGYYDANVAA